MRVLLVVYDNGSFIHYFPQGLAYIAAALIKQGHDVSIYNQDRSHYPDSHLKEYLDKNKFDIVGVGVVGGYYQYRKLLGISSAINDSAKRPFFVIGGHGPSPEPEFFIKKTNADAVIMGEGEETIVELLDILSNKKDISNVNGIAFRKGRDIVVNKRRKLIKDIDSLPIPAYDIFPIDYYRLLRMPYALKTDFVMPVLSARGCPFKCTFCYRMDDGYRLRSVQSVVSEIQFLREKYRINYIAFSDELFMASEKRTMELCGAFIDAKLNIKWACNGRLNFTEKIVLREMKRSGCVFINYGIESMDDAVLNNMKKSLAEKTIIKGIKATLGAGISPGFNIIFGNIGDNKKTLKKGVKFLLKYDDCAQMRTIRPVTPYPGSELYDYAIKTGLLKDCEDFYERKHLNSDLMTVNFTDLSREEFHKTLLEANSALIKNYFNKISRSAVKEAKSLYLEKNVDFRGFRQS